MKPKSMKTESGAGLRVIWENDHESVYPLNRLRDACPCASCAGETVLLRTYTPPPPDLATPGRYELRDIRLVGAYAAQMYWGDGHNTGIYTWERLMGLCPCPEHAGRP